MDTPDDRRKDDVRLATLSEAVTNLAAETKALRSSDRSRKTQMIMLGLSVVLDVILSVVLFASLDNTNEQQDKTDAVVAEIADLNNQALLVCEAGNASAVSQHALWEGVIANQDPTDPDYDPVATQQFLDLLAKTFPQQDCTP